MRRRLLPALLALFLVLGTLPPAASAQQQPGTAEMKRTTGRVEVLRKGQPQWLPGVVGMRLGEGDNVRAFGGASAELELPDSSTLLVAENSRIIISKLDIDPRNQSRFVVFHLVVGKAVASITQATLTLIRARQSNFAITTPTAVAAARGTHIDVTHDADRNVTRVAVLGKDDDEEKKKHTSPGLVTCTSYADRYRPTNVVEGYYTEILPGQGCSPPQLNSLLPDFSLLGTAVNPLVVSPQQQQEMAAPAPSVPPLTTILGLLQTAPAPVLFSPGPAPVTDALITAGGPQTPLADVTAAAPPPSPAPFSATSP